MTAGPGLIVVLAAVVERDDTFLLTRRLDHGHLPGLWEFPGGKCEPDETHEACLGRELMEELGVRASIGPELLVIDHAYPDRSVRLHFRRCEIDGTPEPRLGQQIRWVPRASLTSLEFPEADRSLIDRLIAGR
jgi:8-oxo-dGTP diphosphatase